MHGMQAFSVKNNTGVVGQQRCLRRLVGFVKRLKVTRKEVYRVGKL